MKRRDCLKTLGAAAVVGSVPAVSAACAQPGDAPEGNAVSQPPTVRTEIFRVMLRQTWTTTMSSSDYRDVLYVHYTKNGITGVGEGAPIVRYHEDAAGAERAVQGLAELLTGADPMKFDKLNRTILGRLEGEWAAKSAMDIAVLDWVGQKLGVPIYTLLGLDAADTPLTTFSIGIDTPEMTRRKTQEAAAYPVLKVKVGLDTDEPTIEAVRSVTDKPLRVDANEGWTDRAVALRKIKWLETMGVEMIEQPMPAANFDDIRWLRDRVDIPVFADEACLRPEDIPRLAEAYDGVNIKLDKAGGILQGYRMIQIAKALGLKTMLGCMISSSVTVTAAAHLSPLVDYADLDGNLLIANDPFEGVKVVEGKLVLPDGPGLGLRKAAPAG
jgi:L-alanine-DL-glutamate epimerase-like enolase superfamily enzyme